MADNHGGDESMHEKIHEATQEHALASNLLASAVTTIHRLETDGASDKEIDEARKRVREQQAIVDDRLANLRSLKKVAGQL